VLEGPTQPSYLARSQTKLPSSLHLGELTLNDPPDDLQPVEFPGAHRDDLPSHLAREGLVVVAGHRPGLGPEPLRSGWAWGQQYLENGVAVVDAKVGRGRVLLFGPEVNYRAQSHGTFKFLFNAIYYATAEPATIGAR